MSNFSDTDKKNHVKSMNYVVLEISPVRGLKLNIPNELRLELVKLKAYYPTKNCNVIELTPPFRNQKRDHSKNCNSISKEHPCGLIRALRERYDPDQRLSAHSFRKNFSTKIHEFSATTLSRQPYTPGISPSTTYRRILIARRKQP